jgi:hypothetical protein
LPRVPLRCTRGFIGLSPLATNYCYHPRVKIPISILAATLMLGFTGILLFASQTSGQAPAVCGQNDSAEQVNLKPLIRHWLRGDRLENIGYCSITAARANGFSELNVFPEEIDLNDDGNPELAIRYLCAPVGNCSMNIVEKTRAGYRTIFKDRMSVQYIRRLHRVSHGFHDIRAYMHGSCCDGSYVVYRFRSQRYVPISCGDYFYYVPGDFTKTRDTPIFTAKPCSKMLDTY